MPSYSDTAPATRDVKFVTLKMLLGEAIKLKSITTDGKVLYSYGYYPLARVTSTFQQDGKTAVQMRTYESIDRSATTKRQWDFAKRLLARMEELGMAELTFLEVSNVDDFWNPPSQEGHGTYYRS